MSIIKIIKNNYLKLIFFLIILAVGFIFLPNIQDSKKQIVEDRFHREASEFNESQQYIQCKMKYCRKIDEDECNEKYGTKIQNCVKKQLEATEQALGR